MNNNIVLTIRLAKFADGALQSQALLTLVDIWIPTYVRFPFTQIRPETQSLYALWNCVIALSKRARGSLHCHVPYRLSLLTRILQVV